MWDTPYEFYHGAKNGLFRVPQMRWDRYDALRQTATRRFASRLKHRSWGGFGVLTEAEHELLFATATGLYLPLPGKDAKKKVIDKKKLTEPKEVTQQGKAIPTDRVLASSCPLLFDVENAPVSRWVSADLLRWLCIEPSLQEYRDSLGVFCAACVVVGEFRVDFLHNPMLRIAALNSLFLGTVSIRSANLQRFCLRGSRIIPSGFTDPQLLNEQEVCRDTTKPSSREKIDRIIAEHPDFSDQSREKPENQSGEIDVRALAATGIKLNGDADLSRGFVAEGPVELDNCHIGGSVDLSDSELKRDEMGEDFFPALTIGGGHIGQDLTLMRAKVEGVTHLGHARIHGNVNLQGVELLYEHQVNHAYDQPHSIEEGANRVSCYRAALTMLDAEVGGGLDLSAAPVEGLCYEYSPASKDSKTAQPKFTKVVGGVKLRLAKIGGDLKLHSASIKAHYFRSAIDASGIRVKGSVMAQQAQNHRLGQRPFEAWGNVRFRAARIGGQVDFTSAKLRRRSIDQHASEDEDKYVRENKGKPNYWPTHTWSLDLRNARIGAQLKLDHDFVAEKGVCLRSASIKDRVTIQGRVDESGNNSHLGCEITAPDFKRHQGALNRAIDAFRVNIGGSFYLDGPNAKVKGKVDFSLARIQGRFGIGRSASYGKDRALNANCYNYGERLVNVLDTPDAKNSDPVEGHWLSITPLKTSAHTEEATSLATLGAVSLQHATIGFELIIGPPTIREPSLQQSLLANSPVLIDGRVDAVHAKIGYQVYLGRATFKEAERQKKPSHSEGSLGFSERAPGLTQFNSAIDFTAATVGIDFYVDGSIILGGLCLDSINVTQDLIFRRGIAYSSNAHMSYPLPGHDKSAATDLAANGAKLCRDRHLNDTWAVSLRHAVIHRTVSMRGAFVPFGSLMFLRSRIEGYFELCSASKNAKKLVRHVNEQIVDKSWPATWSINLSGTHVGVVWWSLERSGWVENDYVGRRRSRGGYFPQYSLADLLFINDFSYSNVWFFKELPEDKTRDSADETLVMHSDVADGRWEACKQFLDLQTLPGPRNKRRKRLQLPETKPPDTTQREQYENKLRKFNPQPYEQLASICRTHGRSDLFASCHVEKWRRYTASICPRFRWQTVCTLFVSLLTVSGGVSLEFILPAQLHAWRVSLMVLVTWMSALTLSVATVLFLAGWWRRQRGHGKWEPIDRTILRWLKNKNKEKEEGEGDKKRKKDKNQNSSNTGWLHMPSWAFLKIFGLVAGYGYRPSRLVLIAFGLVLFGGLFASHAHRIGVIRPSSFLGDRVMLTSDNPVNADPIRRSLDGTDLQGSIQPIADNAFSSDYPAFNGFWYAVDQLVPVIGLEQAEYWQPYPFQAASDRHIEYADLVERQTAGNLVRDSGWATENDIFDESLGVVVNPIYRLLTFMNISNYETQSPQGLMTRSTSPSNVGCLAYIFGPMYTMIGWVLVTMGIASATRLIRHE